MRNRIGILGGTFDPIHLGHVHAAESVADEFCLDQLYFVPVFQPVHREQPGANSQQRMHMIDLVTSNNESFTLDDREIERGGPSYSLLTVQEYRQEHPTDQLFFILGTDAFNSIGTWYQWQDIFTYVNLIVMGRPDIELAVDAEAESFLAPRIYYDQKDSQTVFTGGIFISNKAMLTNSATEVRQSIANNASLTGLLDKKVISFIKENNIYGKDLLK